MGIILDDEQKRAARIAIFTRAGIPQTDAEEIDRIACEAVTKAMEIWEQTLMSAPDRLGPHVADAAIATLITNVAATKEMLDTIADMRGHVNLVDEFLDECNCESCRARKAATRPKHDSIH